MRERGEPKVNGKGAAFEEDYRFDLSFIAHRISVSSQARSLGEWINPRIWNSFGYPGVLGSLF